jgi:hypothetical protein
MMKLSDSFANVEPQPRSVSALVSIRIKLHDFIEDATDVHHRDSDTRVAYSDLQPVFLVDHLVPQSPFREQTGEVAPWRSLVYSLDAQGHGDGASSRSELDGVGTGKP